MNQSQRETLKALLVMIAILVSLLMGAIYGSHANQQYWLNKKCNQCPYAPTVPMEDTSLE